MGNYHKEYLDISADNVVCSKITFDEEGITYQCLSELEIKLTRDSKIIHCFCPYGSIEAIYSDREARMFVIMFRVPGQKKIVSYRFCNIDHLDALADSIDFARTRMKNAPSANGIIYDGERSNPNTNYNTSNSEWFKYVFPASLAFFTFWVPADMIFWKLLGAAMAFGIGFLISKWLEKKFSTSKSQSASKAIKIILCVLPILIALIIGFGSKAYDDYKDVFNKDPNKWTDEEKDYVNDFFEWHSNHYDD